MSHERDERERALFLRLLELVVDSQIEPSTVLSEALRGLVGAVASERGFGAERGFVEIFEGDHGGRSSSWQCSEDEVASIRAVVSRGIVASTLAAGETIHTPFAMLDDRFGARESVRNNRLEAVLCTPLGASKSRGVLYLEGRRGAGQFDERSVALAETVARLLAPLVDRLVAAGQLESGDATAEIRRRFSAPGIVGRSKAIADVLRSAGMVSHLDVLVLITGPSGTGKTQLARAIHDASRRSAGPFVELNCATFPDTLIESELFGASKGAHATATQDLRGKVAAAEGGTLFLDEIGELSAAAQAKLLSLLQDRVYFPLGSSTPVHADIRLLAATNARLDELVKQRRFREDLYFRINGFPIEMPPLDARRDDVPLLAERFAEEACRTHRLDRLELSPRARVALATAPWPGNVRQLRSTVDRAAIVAAGSGASVIEVEHVFPSSAGRSSVAPTFQEATRRFQATFLADALAACDWNITECARELDLTRAHVYNLIKAYGLQRSAS